MQLDNFEVYSALKEKGITHLYHANTVATSCSFIEEGGLLSRGAVENRGLPQTPQDSDDIDKQHNVWNDIFLDSVDLHERFRRQNHYGPVLFKLSIDVLRFEELPPVWITKDNPIRWNDDDDDENKYFPSFKEFNRSYSLGAYREMITLRNTMDILPFVPFLEEIIIDDPKLRRKSDKVSFGRYARVAIKTAMEQSEFDYSHVKTTTRQSCQYCYCKTNYWNQVSYDSLVAKFLLENHH